MSLPSEFAIRATNLSKMYRIYTKPSDMFWELIARRPRYREFWALRDISFEIRRGEVVGIVGSNGAGKSTLLKIITGNLDMNGGTLEVNGQVAAILELGSGFNPEYSGRENIYMGGLVAGMTRQEIDAKIENIIEFSGIREFIDQPFKTYSTGMQARLTFSLAISRQAEILILDEALSAGDAIFTNKCLKRIKEICESDATVLFVSHSSDAVRRFCNRAIWLEQGRVVLHNDAETVTKAYDRYVYEQSEKYLVSATISASELVSASENPLQTVDGKLPAEFFKYGNKQVRIVDVKLFGANGEPMALFETGGYLEIDIVHEGRSNDPDKVCHAAVQIFSPHGDLVMSASTRLDRARFSMGERGVFKIIFSPILLGTGKYYISPFLGLWSTDEELVGWLDFHDRLYTFDVKGKKDPGATQMIEHPVEYRYEAVE